MPLPYSLDCTRLARAYASGELTPARVVADVLDEVQATQANPIWIDIVPREAAIARAREIERRRARGERLPLYGLPFAVKDNIDVAGHKTTAGCPDFAYVAEWSADVVEQLEAAGAILVGKTNLDQFATGLVGTRSPYGACRNPFDERYIAGGSSSGSAVAVALGQVSFALGTDTAGSGRVPAGFCNIVGLKPTRGAISTSGVVPACRSLDCVSIFALTVDDALAVLAAARELGSDSIQHGIGSDPHSLRVGAPNAAQREFFGDARAKAAFDEALALIATLDAEIVEVNYEPFRETARLLYEGPWLGERLAAIKPFFDAHPDALLPVTRQIIGAGARFTDTDMSNAQHELEILRRRCAAEWERMDVLAVPTTGTIYTLEEVAAQPVALNTNLGYYTNFVNLLGLCAIAVPAGFRSDGLPAGITLIAPAFHDESVARFAADVHRAAAITLGTTRFELPAAARSANSVRSSAVLRAQGRHQ